MKILYTNFHSASGVGGHTSYVAALAAGLSRRHSIAIAAPGPSALIRIGGKLPGVEAHVQDFPNRVYRLPGAVRRLTRLLKEQQYDIVHVNGSSDHRLVILACLLLRKRPKIVLTKHNDIPVGKSSAWLRVIGGTDHVIAVCDHVRRKLAGSPYARKGITCIFNGIDTGRFTPGMGGYPPALRAQYFMSDLPGRIVLGSNAGTSHYKGWLYMVRAVAQLPEQLRRRFHIAVAGGPLASADIEEVKALGMQDRFTYVGQLDDVRPFLAAIDVGFVLSHRVETISFACREMMASGKPVIVTSQSGLPENISAGVDGWIVPPRSATAVADLLQAILAGAHDIPRMGAAARARAVREFDIQPFIQGTERVYRSLLEPIPARRNRHELDELDQPVDIRR
jgi:glycosyltransferase involved in cell wall biosynthesis